ncbi:MAG: hypothetical protein RR216_05455, partial [Pseudoflavonifractor sp.]
LKGEMTLEDVKPGANIKGIRAVYEAKKAYNDAIGPILQFNNSRKDALRTEAGELVGDVTAMKGGYDDRKAKLTQLKRSNPNMDWDKERNSVEKFRGIYNDLFAQMNATRIANGYEPVDYRAGYFPHFSEKGGDGILDKFAAALGITMEVQNLPTTM